VYDYNRGRELHIEKALDVIDLELTGGKSIGLEEKYEGYTKTRCCSCDEFVLDLYDIKKSFKECSSIERFYIFTCVDGQGQIYCNGEKIEILKGDSVLMPAKTGEYEFLGEMKILKSYVP
jgi:mannose-6-phosphate isomerase